MKPGINCVLTLLVCGFCSISTDSYGKCGEPDTADFVLVEENDGVALYERWYSINPDQQAREIKATFAVKTQPVDAATLIRDESRGRQWNKNTKSYEIVSQSENIWFAYIEYDLPWPVSNQDCVLEYHQNFSENCMRIEFKEADHPSFPVKKRIQRINDISGKWIFRESDDGLSIEYYITTTPSSTLPTWLTDPIIRNNLIETLQEFRSILEERD